MEIENEMCVKNKKQHRNKDAIPMRKFRIIQEEQRATFKCNF